MRKSILVPALALAMITAFGAVSFSSASGDEFEVTITNISKTVLTPPVIAVTRREAPAFFTTGEQASVPLEELAEGGSTDGLADVFNSLGAQTTQLEAPILPGESVTVRVPGWRRGYVHFASMLLPTNDAFLGLANLQSRSNKPVTALLRAYDAGTEGNSESCDDIPGPQCGGEGMNADRDDVDFIHPHAGIHGEGELNTSEYNWSDPVARITVERVR